MAGSLSEDRSIYTYASKLSASGLSDRASSCILIEAILTALYEHLSREPDTKIASDIGISYLVFLSAAPTVGQAARQNNRSGTILSAGSYREEPRGWHDLLNAFVRHDSGARQLVERAAHESADPTVRDLAAMLRDEWDLEHASAELKRPRSVYIPVMESRNGEARAETFVFSLRIASDGRVLAARFLKPPEQRALARVARAKVLQALFRPAFVGHRFVAASAVMKYSVEVR